MVEKTETKTKIVTTTTGTEVKRSGGRGRGFHFPKLSKNGKTAVALIAIISIIAVGIWYILNGAIGLLKGPFNFPHTGGPASTVYTVKTPSTTGQLGVTIPALIGLLAKKNSNVPLAMIQSTSDTNWLGLAAKYQPFTTSALTPEQVLTQFGRGIPVVIFSKANWTQICSAVTLAGIKGYLPIAKEDLAVAAIKTALGPYTVGLDLTTIPQMNKTQLESYIGYSWLWGQVSSQVTKGWFLMNGDARNGDFDLAVFAGAFVFDFLDYNNTTSLVPGTSLTVKNWIDQVFLANYQAGTAVFGFWSETGATNGTTQRGFGLGEVKTVDLLSPLGILMEASGRLNNKCLNSGLSPFSPPAQIPAPAITDDGKTCFVALTIWNADAWGYVGENNWNCLNTINAATKHAWAMDFPMTCAINLSSLTMMPHVAKGYWDLQAASNGNLYLIAGPSGVAYTHIDQLPANFKPAFWKEVGNFLTLAKIEYMQFLDDIPTPPAGFNHGINPSTVGDILHYTSPFDILGPLGFTGPLKGVTTWNNGCSPWHILVNGVPAFAHPMSSWLPSTVAWGAGVNPITTAEVTTWAKNVQAVYNGGQRFIHLIVNLPMMDTATKTDVTYVFANALVTKLNQMGVTTKAVRLDTWVNLAKAAGAL